MKVRLYMLISSSWVARIVPLSLKDKVDPSRAALLVIDVQNDYFMPEGVFARLGYDTNMCMEMIPKLVNLIKEARRSSLPIIYVMSIYNTRPNWYLSEVWLDHKRRRQAKLFTTITALEKGSWGCEIAEAIKPRDNDVLVVKHRYDAFLGTDLDLILRSRGINSVILTGLTTNVCVETTARGAFMRDYNVVFVSDCTASHEPELHDATLKNIDKYFGVVARSDEVMKCWRSDNVTNKRARRTVG